MSDTSDIHELTYDARTHELFKIFFLSLLLSILTLGIYHFWGKTRKRRYMTSSVSLENDRFEYTGYASELLLGLILGVLLLVVVSLPLAWAIYTLTHLPPIETTTQNQQKSNVAETENKPKKKSPKYHFEQTDPLGHKVGLDYNDWNDFIFSTDQFVFGYKEGYIGVKIGFNFYPFTYTPLIMVNPEKNLTAFLALLLTPFYFILYIFYLPFLIVYGALRYRASRLRWRGVRWHLEGSSLLYGLIGLWQTFLKLITLGFWIPLADVSIFKYKAKHLHFGNQKASFTPSRQKLMIANLATIGISIYIVFFMVVIGYLLLPWIKSLSPDQGFIIEQFIRKIVDQGYIIALIALIWICYAPRYWYRAAFFREKYNNLHFGDIGFICTASGWQYCKLFVLNNLIFIFTLGFGLPWIWQRRMRFFCKHVLVTGNIRDIMISQSTGKKHKIGGGFASIMNLEIGLI